MLICGGCASLPGLRPDTRAHVDYYSKALTADPARRETMWKAAVSDAEDTAPARLRRALMRSVPGHSGYDRPAAVNSLTALSQPGWYPEIESVARMRLAELNGHSACQREVDGLRQRMSKLVGIERRFSDAQDGAR